MRTDPIGVIDSGLGGVSTLRQLVMRFPREDFLYFGDCGNAPYGSRPVGEIRALALSACRRMEENGAKALVIACNTSVSVALDTLTGALSIPVVGIRPAIARAAALPGDGRVLMLATEATAASEGYHAFLNTLPNAGRVVSVGCPADVVRNVEAGELSPAAYEKHLHHVLAPYEGEIFDAIVLGCTHYPFAFTAIRTYADAHLKGACAFIEGGREVCDELEAALDRLKLRTPAKAPGQVTFTCSGDYARQFNTYQNLLACEMPAL